MSDPTLTTESRDALARALCDYWDPDDLIWRMTSGYPCEVCEQEANYLLAHGIVQVT